MNRSLFESLKWPIGAIVVFLLVNIIYFLPQLSGKQMRMGDIEQFKAMSKEAVDYQKESGEVALWTNSMFSGMPTYQISAPQKNNLLKFANKGMHFFISRPIGYFFAAMLCFYIMMLAFGANQMVAIIGGIAFGLTTNSMTLFMTGHTSKMMAISYMPLIIGGVHLIFKQKLLLGGALFAFGMGLDILVNHVQMTYYLLLLLGIWGIIELVKHVKAKKLPEFGKAVAVLAIGTLLGVGSSAGKLMTTYEYGRDTMRGAPILQSKSSTEATSSSETEGLAWDYAMQWSNGVGDLAAVVVPRAVGGGSQEVIGNSEAISTLRKKGANISTDYPLPLYWGALPFTSGPAYFGAIIMFLFLFGSLVVKGPIKWWLIIGVVLTMLMSLGKNFSMLNQPMFDLIPLMNKFRAPSSILSVTSVLVPLLALLGLNKLTESKISHKDLTKKLLIATGVVGGFCLLAAIVGPSMGDLSANNDAAYGNAGWDINALKNDRASALRGDAIQSLIFILLAAGAVYGFLKNWFKLPIMLGIVGLLITVDAWKVGNRYISHDSFLDKRKLETVSQPRPVDIQINTDKDLHFRVHDLTADPFNSTQASYHHKTIGGYHAAKLQRYQDMIDRYIGQANISVLNMLNTKYIITNDNNNQPVSRPNAGALGNAWFVDSIRIVDSPEQEIGQIANINPGNSAIINSEFSEALGSFDPQKNGSIKLTSYTPNKLTYQSNSTSEQLAVFSEVWYGPNKGWKLFVDGNEVPLMRANYILRAAKIPAGKHELEMIFNPKSYRIGEMISLFASILIFGAIIFGLYKYFIQRTEVQGSSTNVEDKTKKTVSSKTKQKRKK